MTARLWQLRIAPILSRPWLQSAALVLAAFLAHLPSLHGQLIWDDNYLVGENPFFRSPIFCLEVFRHHLVLDPFSDHYRPVQNLSYILDYAIWNGDLYGYHLSNLLWHSGAGILLFFLLRRLLASWAHTNEHSRRFRIAAFFVALLWMVHPAHSAAVDYISGRADSLAFVFSCAAWITYLRAGAFRHATARGLAYAAAALLLLLGLCSREIAIAWVCIFLGHLLFFQRSSGRHRVLAVTVCALILTAYAGLRQLPEKRAEQPSGESWGSIARAGLMLRALGDYTRIAVFPSNLHMERSIAESRMESPAWADQFAFNRLSLLGLLAALALIAGGCKRGLGRPLRIFGAVWFGLSFLPVSNLVELNATVAEHWLYLPLAGLLLVLLGWLVELPAGAFRAATFAALMIAVALGIRSSVRSGDWLNAQVLYERTLAAGGWSPRVAVNLALIYAHDGRLVEAQHLLERSLETWPEYTIARSHLAVVLTRQGAKTKADQVAVEAAAAVTTAQTVDPRTWTASIQRARRAVEEKQDAEALRILADARLLEPTAWPLAQMQSEILRRTVGPDAALPVIQEFADKNWWQYPAFLALGKLRAQQDDAAGAVAALEHASKLDIRETEALNLIARIQLRARNFPAALAVQQRAVSRQPHEPRQYVLVSEVLMHMGRTQEANEARETALALQQQIREPA